MPRYFFHRTYGGRDPDTDGTCLPDLQAARRAAVRFAAETMRDHPDRVWSGDDLRIEVTDGAGLLLCTLVIVGTEALAA